jgi:hypothetical protein
VVVNVSFLRVVTFLVNLGIVVAVRQLVVIVRMRVPIGAMLEVVTKAIFVVMAHVPVVVTVHDRVMRVGFDLALAFGSLDNVGHRRILLAIR